MNRKDLAKKKIRLADPAVAAALACEEEATERRRIRVLLKLPMLKRTHFLRVRIGRGSAL